MDFTEHLRENVRKAVYKPKEKDYENFLDHHELTEVLEKGDDESEADFQKRQAAFVPQVEEHKKKYLADLNDFFSDVGKEIAVHMIGLRAYATLYDDDRILLKANGNKTDAFIIREYAKNLELMRAQLLKNGIHDFELHYAEQGDRFGKRVMYDVLSDFEERREQIERDNYIHIAVKENQKEEYDEEHNLYLLTKVETMTSFSFDEITDKNNEFYGMLKRADLSFAKDFPVEPYQTPTEIESGLKGYELNDDGIMVQKKGIRLFRASKEDVREFNRRATVAMEGFDNAAVMKTAERMMEENQEREKIYAGRFNDEEKVSETDRQKINVRVEIQEVSEAAQEEQTLSSVNWREEGDEPVTKDNLTIK